MFIELVETLNLFIKSCMNMKKYLLITLTIFSCYSFSNMAFAYKFDFVTVSDIVDKIKEKYGSLESYQASFKIVSKKLGKTSTQSGVLRFKSSDRLLMEFYQPSGQKIVSDGKMMWIYIPSMNVVAEQDLKSDSGLFTSGSKNGLQRLFSKYHYRFASKTQPEEQKDGSKMYTLILKQKESRSGYREIKLWVSEDFFVRSAEGVTSSGKTVNITLTNIKTDVNLSNGIFKFSVPARARVIKNPMISEE